MSVGLGHGLELTSFKLYEQTSTGGWKTTYVFIPGKKYRYRVGLKNINSTAYMPPITEPHSHLEIYAIELTPAGYDHDFYSSSSFTGPSFDRGTYHVSHSLYAGKSRYYNFYFKVNLPNDVTMPMVAVKIYAKLTSAVHKSPVQTTILPAL